MSEKISALLVHNPGSSLGGLETALENQQIQTFRACSCGDVLRLLKKPDAPQLIFTDINLPDGTWADVLGLAEKARNPTCVIVVSPHVDIKLYITALERGAFDFIVPPFLASDLAHIVQCAAGSLFRRGPTLTTRANPTSSSSPFLTEARRAAKYHP